MMTTTQMTPETLAADPNTVPGWARGAEAIEMVGRWGYEVWELRRDGRTIGWMYDDGAGYEYAEGEHNTPAGDRELAELAYEVVLQPSPMGFGEWQCHPNSLDPTNGHADAFDILAQIDGDVYQLGTDDLPEGVEDIRGSIQYEPQHVYALVTEHGVQYFGIDERSVWCDRATGIGVVFA